MQVSLAELAIDVVAELIVMVDGLGRVVYANHRAEVLLQRRADDWLGVSGLEILHPDDVSVATELIVSCQATGEGVKEPVTYRFGRSDGTWVTLEIIASVIDAPAGRFVVISGRPPQPGRPADQILDEISGRLTQMFEEAAIGMAKLTLEGRFLHANARLLDKLGRSQSELDGTSIFEVISEDASSLQARWRDLINATVPSLTAEVRFEARGSCLYTQVTGTVVTDRHGAAMYVALQVVDLTERVRAETALRSTQEELLAVQGQLIHQARHDPLTGVGNRAVLDDVLLSCEPSELAVVYIDLDNFKQVNDRFGHAVGDELLVHVAQRITAVLRPTDVVARMGGDEFLVLAPDLLPSSARQFAQRLLNELALPFELTAGSVTIAASAGLVTTCGWTGHVEDLIDTADRALYRAKDAGRNQLAATDLGHFSMASSQW